MTEARLFDVAPLTERLPSRRMSILPLLARFGGNTESLAAAAQVSQRQVQRWVEEGVDFVKADEIATRAGENPELVWPDWEWDDPNEEERDVMEEKAGVRLDPRRKPLAVHGAAQPMVDDLSRLVIWLTKRHYFGFDMPDLPEDLEDLMRKVLRANVELDANGVPVLRHGDDWETVTIPPGRGS